MPALVAPRFRWPLALSIVAAALFVAEYAPRWLGDPVSFVVELLAVIPSIIYGLWGFFVLAPLMRGAVEPALKGTVGQVPLVGGLFAGPPRGKDMLVAGVILAIMILPYMAATFRELFLGVPAKLRESAFGVGATPLEVVW